MLVCADEISLEATRLLHIGRADDAVSSYSSHMGRVSNTRSDVANDLEQARDGTCLIVPGQLAKVRLACLMRYQEDLHQVWEFFHEQYSTTTPFSKATVHTMLARMEYTG